MAQEKRNSSILPLKKCSKTRTIRSLSTSMIPQTKPTEQLSTTHNNKIDNETQLTRKFSLSSRKPPKPTKQLPLETKKTTSSLETKKTFPPLEIKKKPPPLEIKKKLPFVEIKKKSSPVEIKKNPSPLEIKKKSSSIEIKKNPSPLEIKKNPSPFEIKKNPSPLEIKKNPSPLEIKKKSSPIEAKKKSLENLKKSTEPLVIKKTTPLLTKNKPISSVVKKKSMPQINKSLSLRERDDIETKYLTSARGRSREQKDIKFGNNEKYDWKDNNDKIGDEKEYSEKFRDEEKDVDSDINDKEFLDTLLSKVDLSHPITVEMITQVIELQMQNSLLKEGNQALWQEYKWQSNLERELIEELNKMEATFEKVTSPKKQIDKALNSLKTNLTDSSPSIILQKDQQESEEDLAFLRVSSIIESMKNDILIQLEYNVDKINLEE
ncbi:8601_t:CDS:2 [Dentiscutata erythropus]|uniref:8601_t:CDS:1 n=1 Tax=Dentiscutata erythropus TaxID=1348616 RepID=A0A9N9EIY6_9GLOM|nr:8601_t:CDS:2 [Dentiscutata erythropus]